jgi:hypothetical protein
MRSYACDKLLARVNDEAALAVQMRFLVKMRKTLQIYDFP